MIGPVRSPVQAEKANPLRLPRVVEKCRFGLWSKQPVPALKAVVHIPRNKIPGQVHSFGHAP